MSWTLSSLCRPFRSCTYDYATVCKYIVSGKKEPNCNIFYKTRAILNKFATKLCKPLPTDLNSVSRLPCETWNVYRVCDVLYHWVVRERKSRMYLTLAVSSKFARFESIWLRHIGNTAREDVQNTHHLSTTTTPLTNGCHNDDVIQLAHSVLSRSYFVRPD